MHLDNVTSYYCTSIRESLTKVACSSIDSVQEDFMKAVRKIAENKKLEGKVEYSKV